METATNDLKTITNYMHVDATRQFNKCFIIYVTSVTYFLMNNQCYLLELCFAYNSALLGSKGQKENRSCKFCM